MKKLMALMTILLFLFGCAKYKAVSIPKLQPEFAAQTCKQKDVTVALKVFTKDDCQRHFDKDLIKLGYQPIQIAVDNQSKGYFVLSKSGISLPSVPPEEVAEKGHYSSAGRAVAYGVGGLFIWPLFIPAIVDGVGASDANTQMNTDFAAKGLQDTVIQPYTTINGVIFVPTSQMQPNLTINIIDKETSEKLTFTFDNIK